MKINSTLFLTVALLLLAASFLTSDFIMTLPNPLLVIIIAISIVLINFSIILKVKERKETTH